MIYDENANHQPNIYYSPNLIHNDMDRIVIVVFRTRLLPTVLLLEETGIDGSGEGG